MKVQELSSFERAKRESTKHGFIQINNFVFFNKGDKLSQDEHSLLLLIYGKTIGCGKEKDSIPYTQIMKFCKVSNNSVSGLIKSLVSKGLIRVISYPNSHKMNEFVISEVNMRNINSLYETVNERPIIEEAVKPKKAVGRPRKVAHVCEVKQLENINDVFGEMDVETMELDIDPAEVFKPKYNDELKNLIQMMRAEL